METKKRLDMINIAGTNIITSLGFTTEENFAAVKQGISGLKHYDTGTFDLPESFTASLIDKERLNKEFSACNSKVRLAPAETTDLEKAAILSVSTANKEAKIDLSSPKTIFVISTTKGNVDELTNNEQLTTKDGRNFDCSLFLWHSAKIISRFFNNPNTPLVVSNACISGAAAQIAAMREIENGHFDCAVVVGVDLLSKFIISGFQSFKALSADPCKSFDKERCGLNLGEAAATIIMNNEQSIMNNQVWLIGGAIRNDANHISAPSRVGEGSFRALHSILTTDLPTTDLLSFICAHGTATPYNDAMESVALTRAGLSDTPVNSLKPFFGHTLGAAGVVESIISMCALNENMVLKSLNYNDQNFENQIHISTENHSSEKPCFIKLLSGFGGVNAALLFGTMNNERWEEDSSRMKTVQHLFVQKEVCLSFKNAAEITDCYRRLGVDYPKFFKMDNLSKLGFVASEMIFKDDENRFEPREDIAVVCFNCSSSLEIDTQYQTTIADNDNYFPSPSLFVYTLPNIVNGEICIRNKFVGESSFYVSENFDAEQIFRTVGNVFSEKNTNLALVSWIESFNGIFEVKTFLVTKEKTYKKFSINELQKYNKNYQVEK
jgi:3-oxoacyl-[acyl-carrier-protein] synthase-1